MSEYTYHGDAEELRVDTDEGRWRLHIFTGDGEHVFDIHANAESLVTQVKPIAAWLEEGRDAARTWRPPAGGMTEAEILDVYKDDPGKQHTMLEGLS